MKPRNRIAEATAPDGTVLELIEHDGDHEIVVRGAGLMGSRQHHSEEELARRACEELADAEAPRVMVGGLGIGFTLRAALDLLPAAGKVELVELLPEIVEWNRGPLARHAQAPLEDPRVKVTIGDVGEAIRDARGSLDAIMLDVDNGSSPMVLAKNKTIYSHKGLGLIRRALRPGGRVAFWSATDDPLFAAKIKKAGFRVSQHEAHARPGRKGSRHSIIVGQKT